MDKSFRISSQTISRDDLDSVICGLEVACPGNKVEINEAFDLVVHDERQAAALQALFGGSSKPVNPNNWAKVNKARMKKGKPEKKMGKLSYRFTIDNSVISRTQLNKLLKQRDSDLLGQELTNSAGDRFDICPPEDGDESKPFILRALPQPAKSEDWQAPQ